MILPFGKPPPSAMSSVSAPLGMVSLHIKSNLVSWTAAQGSYTPPHKYREVLHEFEKTSTGLLLGHSYTLVWTPLIFMMLPLPNRALTSFNTDSRAFACKWQAVLRAL